MKRSLTPEQEDDEMKSLTDGHKTMKSSTCTSISTLLLQNGFSKDFVAPISTDELGFVSIITDRTLRKYVQEDFVSRFTGKCIMLTSLAEDLDSDDEDEEDQDPEESKVHQYSKRLASGIHHDSYTGLTLYLEMGSIKHIVSPFRFALGHPTDPSKIQAYIDELVQAHKKDKLNIFYSVDNEWLSVSHNRRRESNLFIGALWPQIKEDIEKFKQSEAWYKAHDVVYTRNYVFLGPPGSGKTSCCKTIASLYNMRLYTLDLGNPSLNDEGLLSLIHQIPKNSVLVMEDIDRVYGYHNQNETGRVSFSILLQIMDGLLSNPGLIIIWTVNELKLDPAMIRHGRISKVFTFENVTPVTAAQAFTAYYPTSPPDMAARFGEKFSKKNISMAALQEFFTEHNGLTADAAIKALKLDKLQTRQRIQHQNEMCS